MPKIQTIKSARPSTVKIQPVTIASRLYWGFQDFRGSIGRWDADCMAQRVPFQRKIPPNRSNKPVITKLTGIDSNSKPAAIMPPFSSVQPYFTSTATDAIDNSIHAAAPYRFSKPKVM